MATKLQEMAGVIKVKREALAKYFEKKGADGTVDVDAAGRDAMKTLNTELNDLLPKYEKLREEAKAEDDNRKALESMNEVLLPEGFHGGGSAKGHDGFGIDRRGQALQLGDLFVASSAYKSFAEARAKGMEGAQAHFAAFAPEASLKTVFSTAAGWDPFVTRLPGQVLSAQQMPKVVDLIPQAETTQHSIKWMLETTYTNSAAEAAESGQYAESAYALTEQVSPVQKIAHFIPTTDEQLADVPQVRDYLNGRLEMGLKQRLDQQLLTGDGNSPNLKGLFNVSGVNAQALSSDPIADAFYKAMVSVQTVGFADPSGIIMHPQNWLDVRLLRTSQGLYIWGNPDQTGPQRMWGIPVTTSTYCTFGSGLVGDFRMFTQLFYRKGIDFLVSNSHSNFFILGQLAVRADMRVAFIVTRPAAISKVTGMRSS